MNWPRSTLSFTPSCGLGGCWDGDRDDVQDGDKNGDQDDVQDGDDGGDHDHDLHGCSVLNEHWGASKDGEKMPTDHMLTFR